MNIVAEINAFILQTKSFEIQIKLAKILWSSETSTKCHDIHIFSFQLSRLQIQLNITVIIFHAHLHPKYYMGIYYQYFQYNTHFGIIQVQRKYHKQTLSTNTLYHHSGCQRIKMQGLHLH